MGVGVEYSGQVLAGDPSGCRVPSPWRDAAPRPDLGHFTGDLDQAVVAVAVLLRRQAGN